MADRDPEILIRAPRAEDANVLGELHVRIWRATYAGMMSASALDALDPAEFASMWARIADDTRTDRTIRVALADGQPIGFAMTGPPRDEPPPQPTQLWALNLAPEFHGSGVANLLLHNVLGDAAAYLWVAHGNARAIAFYRRHGFEFDGGRQHDDELGCDELRMVRTTRG